MEHSLLIRAHAHCTPKGLDAFGHLSDEFIIAQGPLLKVNIRYKTGGAKPWLFVDRVLITIVLLITIDRGFLATCGHIHSSS